MIVHWELEQNTPEWFEARAGKVTASSAATAMSKPTTKGFKDLVKTLAWHRVFGLEGEQGYKSAAMQRGHDLESDARNWYAFNTGKTIKQCGFVESGNCGWSPDGVTERNGEITGGIEIKCLLHKAFMDVLQKREVPPEYRWQVRWGMRVAGIESLDFVAYHPAAGGIVVPCYLEREHVEKMEERLELIAREAGKWQEILAGEAV